jgi:chaperonin GroES
MTEKHAFRHSDKFILIRREFGTEVADILTTRKRWLIVASQKNLTKNKNVKRRSHFMAAIKPLSDRVLVRPVEAEEKTSSGIIIPDTAKEKPQKGTVVEAGPGKVENGNKIEMSVKKGDEVLYGKYSGTEITLDGEEYLIMRESDILGIVS